MTRSSGLARTGPPQSDCSSKSKTEEPDSLVCRRSANGPGQSRTFRRGIQALHAPCLSADRGSSNDAERLPVIRYSLARKGASHPAPLTRAGVIDWRVELVFRAR